ncbi:putative membrane protein [Algoriphagus sp. 4150]|nr:putative membrane protein [Algoriphagus sp. 4150]
MNSDYNLSGTKTAKFQTHLSSVILLKALFSLLYRTDRNSHSLRSVPNFGQDNIHRLEH